MTTVLENKKHVRSDYLHLVCEFPLRPLRTKNDHAAAMKIYSRFAGRQNLSPGENDYIDALTRFIEDYEAKNVRSEILALTPLDALKHLMELHQMNTVDLGYVVGSRGLASEILNGKRGISRLVARKLSEKFAVQPNLFFRIEET